MTTSVPCTGEPERSDGEERGVSLVSTERKERALHLSPVDRFQLLSHLIEEVPAASGGELLRLVSSACMLVVRSQEGRATEAEARFALERARRALLAVQEPVTKGL